MKDRWAFKVDVALVENERTGSWRWEAWVYPSAISFHAKIVGASRWVSLRSQCLVDAELTLKQLMEESATIQSEMRDDGSAAFVWICARSGAWLARSVKKYNLKASAEAAWRLTRLALLRRHVVRHVRLDRRAKNEQGALFWE